VATAVSRDNAPSAWDRGSGSRGNVRYVLTTHSPDALIAAYTAASKHLAAAPECLAYDLAQCDEDSRSFILRIHWVSAEAHMEGFRRGRNFPPFFAAIRDFVQEIAEMRHCTPTGVQWNR
jgi:quinol monooxygenase YgiN